MVFSAAAGSFIVALILGFISSAIGNDLPIGCHDQGSVGATIGDRNGVLIRDVRTSHTCNGEPSPVVL